MEDGGGYAHLTHTLQEGCVPFLSLPGGGKEHILFNRRHINTENCSFGALFDALRQRDDRLTDVRPTDQQEFLVTDAVATGN